MGSGASVNKEISKEWLEIFKAMRLRTSEVQKLYDIYNTVDADRSGSIDVVELLMFLDIERTYFTERIFDAFDKDHTRRVDFYEFVVSVWKFCVLGSEAACVFAFDLYDTNAVGRLANKEVTNMFRELLGSKALEHDTTRRVLQQLLSEGENGYVSEDSWRTFSRLHQALLVNVFGIQNKLRITTLGVSQWEKISKRRIQIRKGCVVRLSDLMVLHSHRKMFTAIKENESAAQRVSSMMRIVLDNTDNAVHKPTPPPSPKREQKNTRILMPTFTTSAPAGAAMEAAVQAARPHPGFAAASSPPRSPDTCASARKGHNQSGAVNASGKAAEGTASSRAKLAAEVHTHVHHSTAGPEHEHAHNQDHDRVNGAAHHHTHHGHKRCTSPTLLHKQQRPNIAELTLLHPEKDVLVG